MNYRGTEDHRGRKDDPRNATAEARVPGGRRGFGSDDGGGGWVTSCQRCTRVSGRLVPAPRHHNDFVHEHDTFNDDDNGADDHDMDEHNAYG